jgi:hypothetical protein
MSQQGRKAGHRGILFRGANGSLWFMRDDSNGPVKLDKATTGRIDKIIGSKRRFFNSRLSRAVIAILNAMYGPIQPDGVIHGGAPWPP